ncbi:fungal-specific transcription factor domain-containing protein [Dactylonectria estremocensis]|uniref:Fungal-specific transcription factor domain-containing protein n=1 Tax=Dactylonectria estremocensis TaxID=1079267 RepID=A0A9P9E864_9HYPO|nr:fungal-specific transcription factor domain-containing protein [Dactylonectria estremocensis]
MPRKHRPYRPKVKGCYECSQRRISCDRASPQCGKCSFKGLQCSGLGIRHRFNDGIAARGKWAGKAIPADEYVPGVRDAATDINRGEAQFHNVAEASKAFTASLTVADHPTISTTQESFRIVPNDLGDGVNAPKDSTSAQPVEGLSTAIVPATQHLLQPSPTAASPQQRFLLSYFSKHIAYEMVAFDGLHNGWRHLVLPIAHADTLVMDAVLSVSAFHLSVTKSKEQNVQSLAGSYVLPRQHADADRLYARAILGLQQRQQLGKCDTSTRHSVLLAILVLLAAAMVTASEDFPVLFQMLESGLATIGGENGLGRGELAQFMMRQIRKMRVYAAPLLSEQNGLHILSSQANMVQLFDCLHHCSQQRPENAAVVTHITNLVEQAHEIYLEQAFWGLNPVNLSTGSLSDSIRRVERFKSTLQSFPSGTGEQVLVWSIFIAASDCVLDEHRSFFEDLLIRCYLRSGFVNILRGIQHLRMLWARRSLGDRWTSLLPEARILVM